jgi:hypothetical protein
VLRLTGEAKGTRAAQEGCQLKSFFAACRNWPDASDIVSDSEQPSDGSDDPKEPTTLALLSIAFAGAGLARRRKLN